MESPPLNDIQYQRRSSQMIKYEYIEQSLKEQFYVNVPFPIDSSVIDAAVEAFFKFLKEPDEVKEHIDFTISPKHRRGDIGFKHRDPNDHIYNDSKDFFHYHPALLEKYDSFIKEHPVLADFLEKAHPIWDLTYKTVSNIMTAFDAHYPGAYDKIFKAKNVHVVVRFLKYNWQSSGKYLAKPHYDAGSCTLAIAESCPGLRIGSNPNDLREVMHLPGNAIFMLSSNFKTVMDADFSAGWHDVVQMDETLIGKPFARWAVVAFIEAHDVEALPRTETHKWALEGAA